MPRPATRFDFKDQYFAANGYFVFDTNFRSSTGYGDAFKWATWGAWGTEGRRGRRCPASTTCSSAIRSTPKRVGHTGHSYGGFMTNWLITQYPDRFAAAITGAGISNWISDYGTADIYRTKETEFFGTPWEKEARDRMIKQSPLTYAGQREDADAVRPRRGRPAGAVRGSRADVLRAQAPRRAGEDDPLRRPAARHRRQLEQRAPMLNELAWWDKYLKSAASRPTAAQGAR